ELGDEHLQAVVGHEAAAQDPQGVDGHLRPDLRRLAQRVQRALDDLGQPRSHPRGHRHREYVGTQRATRAVHEQNMLQWLAGPREMDVAPAARAADEDTPFVVQHAWIALRTSAHRVGIVEPGVDALDLAEELSQQIEGVNTKVPPGVAALAMVERMRAPP